MERKMTLGPNEALIGKPYATELQTPALLLDLDAFQANVMAMANIISRYGKKLRPHVKAHKSSRVGRRQIEAGAVGLCCATVREAEVMARAGLDGVLLTTPVIAPSMVRRIVAAREKINELIVAVDSEAGVDAVAWHADGNRPIGVLVEIDMGQTRTGVTDPETAVRLAKHASTQPNLRYRGIQAYYGHLQHVPTLAERLQKAREKWAHLARFTDALKAAGFAPEIISGGGTGTHHLDLEHGPFTEIQAGSYLFMDKQYGAVELAPHGVPFETALTIAGRVVSTVQPDRVIVDAGFKAMATDAGPALIASGAPTDATYQFMGDEHGGIRLAEGATRPKLGDLVLLVAPHCDPTVNLHDRFHVVQGERLVDIWPIEARGY
jgi:D-serine deaminase-like pyridoxal phosphate-dependent protein